MRRGIALTLICALMTLMAGCAQKPAEPESIPSPIVTIEMETGEIMRLELYPDIAPNTVANFVCLIQQGFYDGLTFHRVKAGFVIQGGDPQGNGTGGPGYTIRGEFAQNGFENELSHTRGVLSMARGRDKDSAGSQFFIMHGSAAYLDGEYAAFGKLIDDGGYAVLDAIANTPPDPQEKPLIEWKIKSMAVDTKGYQYEVVKAEQ